MVHFAAVERRVRARVELVCKPVMIQIVCNQTDNKPEALDMSLSDGR